MRRTRIKICCTQSADEARLAIAHGADALGLVGAMPSGPGPIDDAQRRQAETLGGPACGPATGNPFVAWFKEAGEHLRSLALVPLGSSAVFGLLALGSEDAKRFYPEMGTLYLRRIGELCAAGVTARL